MNIQEYIDNYILWLKNEITFTKMGEYYEITAPFLDPSNDYIQLYVKQVNNEIYFTDDGATINTLIAHGLNLTPARKKQLNGILQQFGVSLSGYELTMQASPNDFPQRKHLFIQAMMRVSDMYMTSRTKVSSLFLDDISTYFLEHDIYCTENIQFLGKSGFSHNYDFLIQRTKSMPARLCMAINRPTKNNMNNALFIWDDTKKSRKDDSKLLVFLNDDNSIQSGVEDGFKNYDVQTIKWSERDINLSYLVS